MLKKTEISIRIINWLWSSVICNQLMLHWINIVERQKLIDLLCWNLWMKIFDCLSQIWKEASSELLWCYWSDCLQEQPNNDIRKKKKNNIFVKIQTFVSAEDTMLRGGVYTFLLLDKHCNLFANYRRSLLYTSYRGGNNINCKIFLQDQP